MGNVTVKHDEILYTCPSTGGVCQYLSLETDRGVSWGEAVALRDQAVTEGRAAAGFYGPKGGAPGASPPWVMLALERPSSQHFFYAVRPNTGHSQFFRPM